MFESKAAGVFLEDRRVHWYGRDVAWLGRQVAVSMAAGGARQMENMARTVASLLDNAAQWQAEACAYAVSKMLKLHNSAWREEGDPELTADQFVDRLTLVSIHVPRTNYFSMEFDDGDLFWGHRISVDGNLNGTFRDAQI